MSEISAFKLIIMALAVSIPLQASASIEKSSEQKYFDFNSQKMVSQEDYEKQESKIAHCSDEATKRVQARIVNGSIPFTSDSSNNADWQRAFHSEYVRQCMSQN